MSTKKEKVFLKSTTITLALPLLSIFFLFKAITGTIIVGWFCLVPWFLFLLLNKSFKISLLGTIFIAFSYGIIVILPLYSLEGWWWTAESAILWEYRWIIWNGLISFFTLLLSSQIFLITGFFLFFKKKYFIKSEINFFLFAVFFSSIWIIIEILREFILNGLTWGHKGYLIQDTIAIQWASLGGLYLLSFLIVLVNLYICRLIISSSYLKKIIKNNIDSFISLKKDVSTNYNFKKYLFVIIIFVIIYGFGFFKIKLSNDSLPDLSVAVIATSHTTQESFEPEFNKKLKRILENKLNNNNLDVVIFPENIFPFLILDLKNLKPLKHGGYMNEIIIFNYLKELSVKNPNTSFLIGVHTHSSVPIEQELFLKANTFIEKPLNNSVNQYYYNSLVVLENGEIVDIYHKRKLLLFSEKTPSFLTNNHIRPMNQGNKIGIKTKNGNFGVFICSEIASSIYSKVPIDSKIIIVSSNDSILPHPQTAKYHHHMTKIKAISHSTPIFRSVKGGISSIINSNGKEIKKIDLSEIKSVKDEITIEILYYNR